MRILRRVDDRIRERAAGAVVGAAIGDALGAGTEATAMARNLWRSLIADDGALVLSDVLSRHVAWLATGPSDVGAQTRLALEEARRGTPEAARAVFERRGPEDSAGNRTGMYCSPPGASRGRDPAGPVVER